MEKRNSTIRSTAVRGANGSTLRRCGRGKRWAPFGSFAREGAVAKGILDASGVVIWTVWAHVRDGHVDSLIIHEFRLES